MMKIIDVRINAKDRCLTYNITGIIYKWMIDELMDLLKRNVSGFFALMVEDLIDRAIMRAGYLDSKGLSDNQDFALSEFYSLYMHFDDLIKSNNFIYSIDTVGDYYYVRIILK